MSVRLKIAAVVGSAALGAGLLLLPSGASADGNILTVGNPSTCPNADYTTIQSAVDAAASGDTIDVCPGTFAEHVTINTPDLTLRGGQAGISATTKRVKSKNTTVANAAGEFSLTAAADGTTIDGFVLTGSTGTNDAITAFAGSSGLTLVNNLIQNNGNGIFLANPDGSQPATISQNSFVNNNAGGAAGGGNTGSGIFVCCGAANNLLISYNSFKQHSQTAINTAGDSSNPSTGIVISDNKSTDDSSFLVVTNSGGTVVDHNTINNTANPLYGQGTAILDFGANNALRITNNTIKTLATTTSSGVSVSNYAGSSQFTSVLTNTISGFNNDVKLVSGSHNAYVNGNKLYNAKADGIVVQANVSGATISRNQVANAQSLACEDDTTGGGTAGTANTWLNNTANGPSSPATICRNTSSSTLTTR